MQIHDQRTVCPGGGKEVGDEFGRDWRARPVLTVLEGVTIIRNHRRDTPGGGPFEGINHQQQLHQALVHRAASRLHYQYVSAAHIFLNLHISLPAAKARNHSLPPSQAKEGADLIAQRLVRGAAEDLELIVYASAV